MRIQHNIPAMNAYRNYNNNTSALSKNLETQIVWKHSKGVRSRRDGSVVKCICYCSSGALSVSPSIHPDGSQPPLLQFHVDLILCLHRHKHLCIHTPIAQY